MCWPLWSKRLAFLARTPPPRISPTPEMPSRKSGPAKPSEAEASSEWVQKHREAWEEARGKPPARSVKETKGFAQAAAWDNQAEMAREAARLEVEAARSAASSSSGAGAARPAFSGPDLEMDEAKILWKRLTNEAFGLPGEFEPQQHVSFVAGRPVVAIGLQGPHGVKDSMLGCLSRSPGAPCVSERTGEAFLNVLGRFYVATGVCFFLPRLPFLRGLLEISRNV